jgi:putative SbcD/Mre11-related phosphoesterase
MRIGSIELTPEKAAIIEDTAIIADLHLGFENVMQDYGVAFPRMQIRDVITNTEKILKKYGVDRLIIAGDLKHEFSRNLPYEWEDVELFLKTFRDLRIEVVRGNHDNFLAAILAKHGIELRESIEVNGWTVVHGHKDCNAERIIMGHEHPAIKIRKGGLYSFPCYLHVKSEREIIVLPAFSPLMSGSDVLSIDAFMSPIFNVNVEDVEIYAVEEEIFYLGKIRDLRRASEMI